MAKNVDKYYKGVQPVAKKTLPVVDAVLVDIQAVSPKFNEDGSATVQLNIPEHRLRELSKFSLLDLELDKLTEDREVQEKIISDPEFQKAVMAEVVAILEKYWGVQAFSREVEEFDARSLLRRLILRK